MVVRFSVSASGFGAPTQGWFTLTKLLLDHVLLPHAGMFPSNPSNWPLPRPLLPVIVCLVGSGVAAPAASIDTPLVTLSLVTLSVIVVLVGATGAATENNRMPLPLPLVPFLWLMFLEISLLSFPGVPVHPVWGSAQVGRMTIPSAPLPVTVFPITLLLFAAGPSIRMPMS